MTETETRNVKKQLAALDGMSVGQLQARFVETFGEAARSSNRQWLLRRVAWRIQALAEGDLAERTIQRTRLRAHELARDADLRLRPPKAPMAASQLGGTVATGPLAQSRDERVPPPGSQLTRRFKGRDFCVTVLPNGFEFEGDVYRSLSAVAHAITGSHWNGMLFFGLTKAARIEANQ